MGDSLLDDLDNEKSDVAIVAAAKVTNLVRARLLRVLENPNPPVHPAIKDVEQASVDIISICAKLAEKP